MKRICIICLLVFISLVLFACGGKTIGTISGPENDCITIHDIVYVLENNTAFSNADKGKYLGKVSNGDITMRVYVVKEHDEYIYTLWDWEGAFYKKVEE